MENSMTMKVTNSGNKTQNEGKINGYNNLLNEFKRMQTGYAAIAIIGQSCLGSVAIMMLLMNDYAVSVKMVLLFFVTIFCMAFNGAVLALLKPKIIFNLLILSVVFSLGVVIASLF